MAKEPELVRASEIGLWAYCQRAWWLARVQGAPHQNPQQLAHGIEMHAAHGARLTQAQWLQRVGAGLLLVALLALLALLVLPRL
ncbi:MAG TPA: hypothetical protein GYA08_03000 [Chloroflexi bacterium]|nr:hypothetical protein [Chloroflexota bacterium]